MDVLGFKCFLILSKYGFLIVSFNSDRYVGIHGILIKMVLFPKLLKRTVKDLLLYNKMFKLISLLL